MLATGTRIVGRAFVDAYKQANINSAAARAAAGNMKAVADGDKMTKASGITVDESLKILNLEDINDKESMLKKYEHLFTVNDPKKGGSHYLQSKIIRARERIEMEWAQEKLKAEQEISEALAAEKAATEGGKVEGEKPKTEAKSDEAGKSQ
ncbi:mitochondrial import inner membrane translocase subunit TIM16 [Linderina macrospora]|uniref:Mitochondrial import inner membrane translocase subunit TIM16 n=1 Tax=Linderina macrospora TaxID=4868 RepID=A0ACC1JDZ3_9FUNG|nr:mitochondrial import inner membrane translocase subunit TIM16 [Linderina macrospora]